jgi:hypothetical protein
VVYVNMAQSSQQVSFTLAGTDKQVAGIKKYTTSSSLALNYDRNLPYEYNGEYLEIPARSVVTLVIDLADACQPCDINCDGSVDVADVNIIINIMLGKTASDELQARSDVTGDGSVDVADVNIIINTILGK